jgi:hypothetical protein
VIPVYSFTRVRSTNTKCTRGCGCNGHPAFPTPSLGGRFINGSGALRGEDANVCLRLERRHCERLVRRSTTSEAGSDEAIQTLSFRDGPQDQTRNLEIPGSMLRIAPE